MTIRDGIHPLLIAAMAGFATHNGAYGLAVFLGLICLLAMIDAAVTAMRR